MFIFSIFILALLFFYGNKNEGSNWMIVARLRNKKILKKTYQNA